MATKTVTNLKNDITTAIPDNTTGLVSPEDVRENMKDICDSLDAGAGWAMYVDDLTIPSQSFGTTPSQLTINGLGAGSTSAHLPVEIRGGAGELWDTTTNKITPIETGDGYTLRLDFEVTADTGVNDIIIQLDIGSGTPINIVTLYAGTGKGTPYFVSQGFPFFSLATFKANGGKIMISTDNSSITVTNRNISIHRISSGVN